MKQLLTFILLSVFIFFSCTSKPEIPERVLSTFTQMFPDANDIEWEMEDEGEWEVEFKVEGKELNACFTTAGKWIETEWEVPISEIPESVMNSLNSQYEGWEIEEIEFVESPEFIGFEFEIEKDEEEFELMITADGHIVKIENVEQEADETDKE